MTDTDAPAPASDSPGSASEPPGPALDPTGRPKADRAAIVLVALCAIFLLVTFFAYAGR
jgi:hypothetical protein